MTVSQREYHVQRHAQECAAAASATNEQAARIHENLALLHARSAGLPEDRPADGPPALAFTSPQMRRASEARSGAAIAMQA